MIAIMKSAKSLICAVLRGFNRLNNDAAEQHNKCK